MTYTRYAIFYLPAAEADWARTCTKWLGWDSITGRAVDFPDSPDLLAPMSELTRAPRRYGLHATLKPPFRLASGQSRDDLKAACAALADDQCPVQAQSLELARMGRFLALCPVGSVNAINALAARCVSELELFRAPATKTELDRRRGSGLSVRQDHNLTRWGYAHVMDLFRFHITLTGRLPENMLENVETTLNDMLRTQFPSPFNLNDLALMGEDDSGLFHLIHRYPFRG